MNSLNDLFSSFMIIPPNFSGIAIGTTRYFISDVKWDYSSYYSYGVRRNSLNINLEIINTETFLSN